VATFFAVNLHVEKNKCGRGQPPRPHCSRIPALPCHRMAADDRFSPTTLPLSRASSAAFAKASCRFMILRSKDFEIDRSFDPTISRPNDLAITNPQPLRQPAALSRSLLQRVRSGMGEEAATPGQPVALARVFWRSSGDSPSRIAGCRWLCRNHPASSGTLTFR